MSNIENHSFLFKMLNQGVAYYNIKGQIIDANIAAENILGLSIDKLKGQLINDPIYKNIYPDGSEYLGENHPVLLSIKTGKPVNDSIMGIFNSLKNEYTWIKINAIPQYRNNESNPYQVLAIFSDITNIKLAEDELNSTTARNKALLDANPDIMFVFSAEGLILDYHTNNNSVLYLPPSHFLGKKVEEVLPNDIAEMTIKKINTVLSSKQLEYSTYTLTINSQLQYFEARYVPHHLNEVLAIVRNITYQKKAQESLLHRERLIEAVASASKALLSENSLDINIDEALKEVGLASNQDRVYVFQFHKDLETGEQFMSQRYEWAKTYSVNQAYNPDFQNIRINEVALVGLKT